jgi:hypothetical protein
MLWAATHWEEGFSLKQLPCLFDNEHTHREKLMEEWRLCCRHSNTSRCPVLNVPGHRLEVRHVALLILADVVVGHLAG